MKRPDKMTDSSITFGSVFGVIIVQEGQKDKNIFYFVSACVPGYVVAKLVEALRYKAEGRGFNSRKSHWDSSLA